MLLDLFVWTGIGAGNKIFIFKADKHNNNTHNMNYSSTSEGFLEDINNEAFVALAEFEDDQDG